MILKELVMNYSDRKKMHEVLLQLKNSNGNKYRILSVDIKNDLTLSFLEDSQCIDANNCFYPMVISDESDPDGNLMFLDRIHELLVLDLGYKLIETEKKKWHSYAGCTIKTYPGEKGTCFLNINDNQGNHVQGFPINEINTIDYNDKQKMLVISFIQPKPVFRFSWVDNEVL